MPVESLSNLLLLGASDRHVGKTEYACALIRQQAGRQPVVAVKVTAVSGEGHSCPRGGDGCGVCGALRGPFCLTEETATASGKDTARLKAAGADRVFWLRVRRDRMSEGIRALRARIADGACVICESNAVREVLEPAAFLVLRKASPGPVKPSCEAVRHHADREVVFLGDGWDFAPERCRFEGQRWLVPADACAAVLAGGQSRRMGQDKSLLPFAGRRLIEHILDQLAPVVDEVVIGSNDAAKYACTGHRVVPDQVPGQGPLMGIVSCVAAARHSRVFVVACDIPRLPEAMIRDMLRRARRADVVVPRTAEGRYESTMAVYGKAIVPVAQKLLAEGRRKIADLFREPSLTTDTITLPAGDWYRNINTPDDYQSALRGGDRDRTESERVITL